LKMWQVVRISLILGSEKPTYIVGRKVGNQTCTMIL
jgi:hypothetical protein